MPKIEIPQEENSTLDGYKKVMYALDDEGNFNRQNYGSSTEEFATKTAVEEFEMLVNESLQSIKKGKSSPIEYFMYKNRMDIQTLASIVGFFSFRVKRHLKMKIYLKLDEKVLNRYCEAFGITIKELKEIQNEFRI